eukprot:gene20103-14667_t
MSTPIYLLLLAAVLLLLQPSSLGTEYYGFRIQQSTVTDSGNYCYLNLGDVYIYSYAGTQITPSGNTFPSPMSNFPASNCFDGNSNTFCHTDGTCSSSYLDFFSTQPVLTFVVVNRVSCCQYRINNAVWTYF